MWVLKTTTRQMQRYAENRVWRDRKRERNAMCEFYPMNSEHPVSQLLSCSLPFCIVLGWWRRFLSTFAWVLIESKVYSMTCNFGRKWKKKKAHTDTETIHQNSRFILFWRAARHRRLFCFCSFLLHVDEVKKKEKKKTLESTCQRRFFFLCHVHRFFRLFRSIFSLLLCVCVPWFCLSFPTCVFISWLSVSHIFLWIFFRFLNFVHSSHVVSYVCRIFFCSLKWNMQHSQRIFLPLPA